MEKTLVTIADAAYIAGLFDGEGTVDFARRKEKKRGKTYTVQRIALRIEMTDESVLNWVHEILGVGTIRKRNRSASGKMHGFIRSDSDKRYMFAKYFGPMPSLNYIS